jgi:hypothetical protein
MRLNVHCRGSLRKRPSVHFRVSLRERPKARLKGNHVVVISTGLGKSVQKAARSSQTAEPG